MSKNAKLLVGIVIGVAVLGVGAYTAFALLAGGDSPPPVSLSDATTSTGAGDPEPLAGGIDGSWKVSDGSLVGYRVREKLARLPAPSDAVGRTSAVTGSATIAGTTVETATFTADLTGLESDDAKRDGRLRTVGLQTSQYPDATFKLTEPITLPGDATSGSEVNVTAVGDLTLHGKTNRIELPLQARLTGSEIEAAGSVELTMTDYGITPPSFGGIVEVGDKGTLEVQLVLTKA